jgi:hypothetical protein
MKAGTAPTNVLIKGYITSGLQWFADPVTTTNPSALAGWNVVTGSAMPSIGAGYIIGIPTSTLWGVSDQATLATYPVRPAQIHAGMNNPVPGPNWQYYMSAAGTSTINVYGVLTSSTSPPRTASGFLNIRTTSQP